MTGGGASGAGGSEGSIGGFVSMGANLNDPAISGKELRWWGSSRHFGILMDLERNGARTFLSASRRIRREHRTATRAQ
jgi:hypothetical protein